MSSFAYCSLLIDNFTVPGSHCESCHKFQAHSIEEPLSRPPGALFQVGSGSGKLGEKKENIPEPISEFSTIIFNLEATLALIMFPISSFSQMVAHL